jgi:2-dehydropantoate 2-reductase
MRIHRVAIVGAGAMGGMYAAHFASTGFDVSFVARGERAERLRSTGLTVNEVPLAADVLDGAYASGGSADLVIFAVKDRHLAAALDDVAPVIGPETILLSVMNGLESEEQIGERFGSERVLLCVAMAMDAQKDGNAVFFRQPGRLVFGRADGQIDDAVVAAQQALTRAGLAWETPPDMLHRMWWKFMVNVGINQASAVLRLPYGAFQSEGDARSLMWALVDEVIAVANQRGVGLGPDDRAAWDNVLAGQPVEGWTSMLQDVDAGRTTEVESFAGRVVELGREHGVPTPYNQAMLWILRAGG